MAYTSGSRSLLSEMASWAAAAAAVAVAVLYQGELRAFGSRAIALVVGEPTAASSAAPSGRRHDAVAASPSSFERVVELSAERHGHFFATAYVNERPVEVMVDTGASMVAMSHEDAEAAGIRVSSSDYTHRVSTANGTARVAIVTLDTVRIGDITVRDVRAAVSEPGALKGTLLGMSFLSRLRMEFGAGKLVLRD